MKGPEICGRAKWCPMNRMINKKGERKRRKKRGGRFFHANGQTSRERERDMLFANHWAEIKQQWKSIVNVPRIWQSVKGRIWKFSKIDKINQINSNNIEKLVACSRRFWVWLKSAANSLLLVFYDSIRLSSIQNSIKWYFDNKKENQDFLNLLSQK